MEATDLSERILPIQSLGKPLRSFAQARLAQLRPNAVLKFILGRLEEWRQEQVTRFSFAMPYVLKAMRRLRQAQKSLDRKCSCARCRVAERPISCMRCCCQRARWELSQTSYQSAHQILRGSSSARTRWRDRQRRRCSRSLARVSMDVTPARTSTRRRSIAPWSRCRSGSRQLQRNSPALGMGRDEYHSCVRAHWRQWHAHPDRQRGTWLRSGSLRPGVKPLALRLGRRNYRWQGPRPQMQSFSFSPPNFPDRPHAGSGLAVACVKSARRLQTTYAGSNNRKCAPSP